MLRRQLLSAMQQGCTFAWDDPDPIPGNNYRINEIIILGKEMALINYGGGSEAEVYLHEILILSPEDKKKSWLEKIKSLLS